MSQPHAYPFLSNPPSSKPKHRPQPISTPSFPRWTPAGRSPSFSRRRRSSVSLTCSTPSVYTPSPVFGSHSYSQHHTRRTHAPPSPSSPKRSPRRRPSPPTSPFAPPSRMTTSRPRADSPPKTPTKTPKLAKIRSLTNLRGAAPPALPPTTTMSSAPPPRPRAPSQATIMTIAGSKPSTKRAKRSATPAKNSQAFQKYRPMPFYQQMQIVQFLEGGTMESHIQRYHQEAGLGKSAKKTDASRSAVGVFGEEGPVHGYAFTDERGMIWFDEEEEWEFACLIPKMGEQKKNNKLKRMFGKGKGPEAEEDWEQFRDSSAEEDAAAASDDDDSDDAEWDDDDLASFGGDVAPRRPAQSVLKMPKEKKEKPRRRRRSVKGQPPKPQTQPPQSPRPKPKRTSATTLKQEFLATSFAPAPAPPSPRRAAPRSKQQQQPPAAATNAPSRFALFGGKARSRSRSASAFHIPAASLSVPTFHLHPASGPTGPYGAHAHSHSHSQSRPNTAANSVVSFQIQARSEQVQWNWTEMPGANRPGSSSSSSGGRPSTESVAPPIKAAKRLGVEAGVVVPMMHGEAKKEKKGWFGRR